MDPTKVDPVDSRVLTDILDQRNIAPTTSTPGNCSMSRLEYMHINRFEQAAEAFERVARFADDEDIAQEAWVNKGAAHGQLEEWDEAIGSYREALNSTTRPTTPRRPRRTSHTRCGSPAAPNGARPRRARRRTRPAVR